MRVSVLVDVFLMGLGGVFIGVATGSWQLGVGAFLLVAGATLWLSDTKGFR